jgi:hypothetical protein
LSFGQDDDATRTFAARMRNVTSGPIEVIVLRQGPRIRDLPNGVTQRPVPGGHVRSETWIREFAKYGIAQWYEFDAIVFVDERALVLHSLDQLFDLASRSTHSVWAPRAHWLPPRFPFVTLVFVVAPRRDSSADRAFREMLELDRFPLVEGELDWFSQMIGPECGTLSSLMSAQEFVPDDSIGEQRGMGPLQIIFFGHRPTPNLLLSAPSPKPPGLNKASKVD